MAVTTEYLSGGRIQGRSDDASIASTTLNETFASNTGWTTNNSSYQTWSASDGGKLTTTAGSHAYKSFAIGEPTTMVMDFDWKITNSSPDSPFVILSSQTSGYGDPAEGHKRIILMINASGSTGLRISGRYRSTGDSSHTENNSSDNTWLGTYNVKQYYRFKVSGGNFYLSIYGSAADRQAESNVIQTISVTGYSSKYTSGTADFAYLDVGAYAGSGQNVIYNWNFWTGITNPATDKSKDSITDVPAGTRYEETDTRKIFRRKDEGYTASIGTDADWTTSTDMASNSSVTSPTGLGAKSWYSNGSSSVIQMDTAGRESLFPVGADFSMSIWLYFSSIASETTAQNAPIMFPTDGSGVRWENAWRGSGSNFGRMVMDLNDGSNSSNTDANGYTAHGMSNNTWYLWVYTFDASDGTGTLYKGEYGSGNDSNVSQYTTSGTTSCTGAPNDPNYKMIGVSSEVLGGDGNARVNDVAIWNKVLSSTEMHEMFNSASSTAGGTAKKAPDVNKTAIRAYWDCQTHTATISNAATKADWVEKGTA